MDVKYESLRSTIRELNLNISETFELKYEGLQIDKRVLSIQAFFNTESIYLQRIVVLLSTMFTYLDDDFNNFILNPIVSRNEVRYLLSCFTTIYTLHAELNKKINRAIQLNMQIGDILVEFLGQAQLLKVYENYIIKVTNCLTISKKIESKTCNNKIFKDLTQIIISPIQKFPQLSMAIGDIYKNTPEEHSEKVCLFKSLSLTQSIASRLDRCRRNYEHNNIEHVLLIARKLKLSFPSKKLLSNHSVFELKTKFTGNGKVNKIPYSLILADKNVIMIPSDLITYNLSKKSVFSYRLEEVNFEQYCLTEYDDLNSMNDAKYQIIINQLNCLFQSINSKNTDNNAIVKEYCKILCDFTALININNNVKKLNFSYSDINDSVSKSLLELERDLKEKEKDVNTLMSSVVTLKAKSNILNEEKCLSFGSATHAKEWRINFNRAKLLAYEELEIDWFYYFSGSNFDQLSVKELPLVFQPFFLNKIENLPVRCVPINLVSGTNVLRCLWMCCADNNIIILHFDYREWKILERFQLDLNQPIKSVCEISEFKIDSKEIQSSDIWIAVGDCVFIYSLVNNQKSEIKTRINFQSEIKALCVVEDKVLISLDSNIIVVFGKSTDSIWRKENEILLKSVQNSSEEIQDLIQCNQMVYVIFEKRVILIQMVESKFLLTETDFESDKNINVIYPRPDTVWIAFDNQNTIILYNRFLSQILNVVEIPSTFLKFPSIGNVTAIYADDKYIWLGTENGFIVCIWLVDSLYCISSNVPMYFSAQCANGAISQLIPFENIQSIRVKKDSIQPSIHQNYIPENESSTDQSLDGPKDEVDAVALSSLQAVYNNWKHSTLTLILALGTGINKYVNTGLAHNYEPINHNKSTIFTFFE